MANRDIPSIREFCRQKATINVFISHSVSDFDYYKIENISDYLQNQEEINKAYYCEEDLKGNIDKFMKKTVPKCQIMLFVGTQNSIFDSEDCSFELFLARKHKIPIIPIKGIDVSWDDLASIGLSVLSAAKIIVRISTIVILAIWMLL